MPSKRRRKLEEKKRWNGKNIDKVACVSRARYIRDKEIVIARSKARYACDKTTRKQTAASAIRTLLNDSDARNKNRARSLLNTKRRLENDEEYRNKKRRQSLVNTKRRLKTDEDYNKINRERSKANAKRRDWSKVNFQKRQRYNTDKDYREIKRMKALARINGNSKNKQKNEERSFLRYHRVKNDTGYKERHRINVQFTRNKIYKDLPPNIKRQLLTINRRQILSSIMHKTKPVTKQQIYWIRRSRFLAAAAQRSKTRAQQEAMHRQSCVNMLDVRLMFKKAEQISKQAAAKTVHLHKTAAGMAAEYLLNIPDDRDPTRADIEKAFPIHLHTASGEPYFWEQAYNTYGLQEPIKIDDRGVAHIFPAVNTQQSTTDESGSTHQKNASQERYWHCLQQLCKISDDIIDGVIHLLRAIRDKHTAQCTDFYTSLDTCDHRLNTSNKLGHYSQCTAANGCSSLLRPARIMSCHFTQLRTFVRRLYDLCRMSRHVHEVKLAMSSGSYQRLQQAVQTLSDILTTMNFSDGVSRVETQTEQQKNTTNVDINEEDIMERFGRELREVADMRDQYITQSCELCEQLQKDLSSLASYVDKPGFSSEKMQNVTDLLYQHKTKYEDVDEFLQSTLICKYCADKLKSNKEVSRSVFNGLASLPTPACVSSLNLFEKTLIKFVMTCMTVVRLSHVTNKSRPNNELTAALKGRIAYLPVDVGANARFVPDNLFNVDSLVVLVGGQPTKQNRIWTACVNFEKLHTALQWLRENNRLYKDVPAYTVEEIRQKIANKLGATDSTDTADDSDASLIRKLDDASRTVLYEHFTTQPLNSDYPADSLVDYQLARLTGQGLNIFDADIDVAAFPELFPSGQYGMKDTLRPVKIGNSEYIKSRLLNRDPKYRLNITYLFHLFQFQEVASMCHSVGHMLRTVTGNQLSAKALYERLQNRDGELQTKMFSLMSNIRGSKQYFAKLGMQIKWMIRQLGPPSLFITCSTAEWFSEPFIDYLRTVNSSVEGVDKMTPAELCSMDPVNVSIHFTKKWNAIFSKLIKSKSHPLFGPVQDFFWRIEYQARGAGHVHCLLWIEGAPVIGKSTPDEVKKYIESIVTCKIPDASKSPTLNELVLKFQQHKCNSYCLKTYKRNGSFYKKCRFGFPRLPKVELELNDIVDCLATSRINRPRKRLYQISRDECSANINDYNPALLLANQANVDVQFIGHTGSRLPYYITDYITKNEQSEQDQLWHDIFTSTKTLGSNAMSFALKAVQSRQVGANEAADRLLGHKLYSISRQTRFADLQPIDKAKRVLKPVAEIKKLLEQDPESANIFQPHWVLDVYPDRPDALEDASLYTLLGWYDREVTNPTSKSGLKLKHLAFELRKRQHTPYIVTHQIINPNQSDDSKEKYFYFLLKLFKPWRTESDITIPGKTYQETYELCKSQLPDMQDYHERNVHISKQQEQQENAVQARAEELRMNEDTMDVEDQEGALHGCITDHVQTAMNDLVENHRNAVQGTEETNLEDQYGSLNVDQKRIVDTVVGNVCETDKAIRLVVSGQGGTGKSRVIHVINKIVTRRLSSNNLPVVLSAPTGLAAYNIGGTTIHRVLCLSIEHGKPADYSRLNPDQLTTVRNTLKNLKLLIVDEVSMISSLTLLYMHLRLSEIMSCQQLFGGVSVVFFADFLQLPPVKGNQPFVPVSFLEAKQRLGAIAPIDIWGSFKYDELTINMRQKDDQSYASLLSSLRIGKVTPEHETALQSRLIEPGRRASVGEICNTYNRLVNENKSPLIIMPRTALCDEVNGAMLNQIGSTIHNLRATDTLDTIVDRRILPRVEAALKKVEDDVTRTAGLEKTLRLCKGARVMLKRNKDVEIGLVNGSMGYVTEFVMSRDSQEVQCLQIRFDHIEKPVNILRESFSFEVLRGIYYTRKQFPIMLAFAITVHKAQGLSLKSAIVDAGSGVFGMGMTYVALSRVTTIDGLHLIDFDKTKVKSDRKAIAEYNRLRSQYKPDLGEISSLVHAHARTKNVRAKTGDPNSKRRARFNTEGTHSHIKPKQQCTAATKLVERNKRKRDVGVNENSRQSLSLKQIQRSNKSHDNEQTQSLSLPILDPAIYNCCQVESTHTTFQQSAASRLNLEFVADELARTATSEHLVSKHLQTVICQYTKSKVKVNIYEVVGDGNCMFRAVSLGITGTQNQHAIIRDYIVNHMLDDEQQQLMQRLFLKRHIQGDDANERLQRTYEDHLTNMQQLGTWGTEQEIIAAANLFDCSILCFSRYNDNQYCLQHFPPHFATDPTCSHTCHHNSLYLVNSSGFHYNFATVHLETQAEE
jgi:hypothetical protein